MTRSAVEDTHWLPEAGGADLAPAAHLRLVGEATAARPVPAAAVSPWWIWGLIIAAEVILAFLSA